MEELKDLESKLIELEAKLEHISRMSIFLNKDQYEETLVRAIRESLREDDKVKLLQTISLLCKVIIGLCISCIIIMMWLAK